MSVTIVIPVWNEEPQHLGQAVDSVADSDAEIIVVNDGSTDTRTLRALDRLQVNQVIHQDNAGPAAARNTGIAASSGDYILLLDSDDYLGAGSVESLSSTLDRNSGCPIAYGLPRSFGSQTRHFEIHETVTITMLLRECLITSASMFRRESWERAGGLDPSLRIGMEDWEWWVRLLIASDEPARLSEGAVHYYRLKDNSRNHGNWTGFEGLQATRRAMIRNNPGHESQIIEAMLEADYQLCYSLGQNQSPIATAATATSRHYERRYGKIEGAISRLQNLGNQLKKQRPKRQP